MVRVLGTHGVKGPVIVFYFSFFSCLSVVPWMLFHFTPMSMKQLVTLLMAGLFAAGGQFTITAAYTYAPAGKISIFDYSQIIFATMLGFVLFGEIPGRVLRSRWNRNSGPARAMPYTGCRATQTPGTFPLL